MLFLLPPEYCGKRRLQVEAAIFRLIKRHGNRYWAEAVIKLTIWPNPDGRYLLKGGGPTPQRASPLAERHPRQALWHHTEHRTCGTASGAPARCM
jgi:hypothetical protein